MLDSLDDSTVIFLIFLAVVVAGFVIAVLKSLDEGRPECPCHIEDKAFPDDHEGRRVK
ncbi:MAG: hypothetical protein PUI29_09560 [Aeromonadales bacterium]|nr:hypothetical protein [Aeromonadales bacterium]MDY2891164.1 hypothetical protein [Succinivibrio sp.]